MKSPIIVFTDDVDVFESPDDVISYFEPWIVEGKCEAFDYEARILKLVVKSESKKILGIFPCKRETLHLQETKDFKSDELKWKTIEYLKAYLKLFDDKEKIIHSDLTMMSHQELINLLIEIKKHIK